MTHPSTPHPPGAMTRAMNATALPTGPKVLRIGVMQGTRITEERIVRDRSAVTVGASERNTFTVAAGELPPSLELFSIEDGRYSLHLTDAMEGQLATPGGIRTLAQLRRDPAAQRTSFGHRLALDESARGKIRLGAVTFLFQFVAAPPAMPRPQLPAALRSHWVKNVDWTYNSCFSAFLVLAIASVAYVEYAYDPIVDDELALDDARLVRLLATPPPVAEPEPEAATEPSTEASATPTPGATATPTPTAHRPAPTAADRAASRAADDARRAAAANAAADRAVNAVSNAMNNSADFAALTGVNGSSHRSARDALAEGGLMTGTDEDLRHAGGVTTASNQVGVHRGALAMAGPPGGRSLGETSAVRSTGDQIGTGPEVVQARVIRFDADMGDVDERGGEGTVNADSVARLIRGQLGGIRSCYERELRQNPALSGRLDVNFTLGTSGRITTASTSGLSAAPRVGSCITGRLRGLVFPVPQGGSVDFSFPFTFTPGG
jgi:hypothetical protein